MLNKPRQLDTPCVGICSTVYGDDICRGCKRSSPEIIEWNALDKIQKQRVFDRLGNLITETIKPFVTIHDPALLRNQLNLLGIRYREDQSAYCDLYYLLRAGASQIESPNEFGFMVKADYQHKGLSELFAKIENDYLAAAQYGYIIQHQATNSQEL
jgi:predicted Fe-S protein YdhL (DUF1289 family)